MELHMHAHPMLTPLLPLRSPEEVSKDYPADAAAAYRLIWDNTRAHLRIPSAATENVNFYQVDEITIGLRLLTSSDASVTAILPELDDYRINEHPIPIGGTCEIGNGGFQVNAIEPSFVPAPDCDTDVAALLEWMDALQVVSAGRLGDIIDELKVAGWITLDVTQYRLTNEGTAQLRLLSDTGLGQINGVAIARWKYLISSCFSNNWGLEELLSKTNSLFGTSVSIPFSAIESAVTGEHTAEEAYALRDQVSLSTSSRAKFPAGMDPDRLLVADDPLRAERNRLESELSGERSHQWLCLSVSEKALIRTGSVLSQCTDDAERHRFCESIQFDARTRWLVGLDAEASVPSQKSALRAYSAWMPS
jgi:hypothetical protein